MKTIKLLALLLFFGLGSCSTISVYSDYDKNVSFEKYKTYAYVKKSIDKVSISDLDKKRILNSIDEAMSAKGFTKSETPDLLVTFFTQENQRVDVYNNYGWYGWGYGYYGYGYGYPYWGMGYSSTYSTPEGTLFIDFVDASNNALVWQGEGNGYLTKNAAEKDARIREFVTKIIAQYPPAVKKEKK